MVQNPLHGVESTHEVFSLSDSANLSRIHYMELKDEPCPECDCTDIIDENPLHGVESCRLKERS